MILPVAVPLVILKHADVGVPVVENVLPLAVLQEEGALQPPWVLICLEAPVLPETFEDVAKFSKIP